MKNLKIIFLTIVTLVAVSCSENWLQEEPNTFLSPENTYTTEAGIEKALVPLYRTALDYWGGRSWTKGGNDVMWSTINTKSGSRDFDNYGETLTPSVGTVKGWWNSIYEAISKANFILKYVDEAEWTSETTRGQLEGEARFFRAWYYFEAVQTWGDVPLLTEPVAQPKTDYTRTNQEEVLDLVVSDLQFAVNGLGDVPPQRGRITRGAAMNLLCNVYLFRKQWADAEQIARQLIANPAYKLVTQRYGVKANQPGTPFSDMFMDENVNIEDGNTENFWVIQYGPRTDNKLETRNNTAKQAWWLDYAKIPGLVYSYDNFQRGKYRIRVSPYWLSLFEPGDHRISEFAVKQTWLINDAKYVQAQQAAGKNINLGDTVNTDFSIPEIQKYYWPVPMKFIGVGSWTTSPTETATEGDIAVMRLGETYLFLAEALLMQNKQDEAAPFINVLRSRANASPVSAADITLDFILDERARELVAEENRWATLKRTGKLLERVRTFGESAGAANIAEKHLLMPIPQTEIDLNKDAELAQNPGYL